jgi:hypothetical protein
MVIARVHVSVNFFSVSVRFYVLLTFWLLFLLLLDSRSAIQISWTCCSLSSRCWQDLRGAASEELPLLPNVVILHKSQSVTLSQVVCDISDAEFASGLAYMATSRASKLKDLMFDAPFDRSCVYRDPRPPTRAMQMKIDDYETRRQQQQLTRPLYNPLSDHSSMDDDVENGP